MIERFKGDTYPIFYKLKINGEVADLSEVNSVKYTYALRDGEVTTIDGVVEVLEDGVVRFDVSSSNFSVVGDYFFDIEVNYSNDIKRTFIKDKIRILQRV